MNKLLAFMSLVLAVFIAALAVVPEMALADKPTYARARPIWNLHPSIGFADHTYVCYKGSKERCFANYGDNTGGSKLDGSSGTGDTDHVSCVHDEGKYKDGVCYQRQNDEAVCHQESNLGLADAEKKVTNAKGYSLSKKLFGSYGLSSRVPLCIQKCRAK